MENEKNERLGKSPCEKQPEIVRSFSSIRLTFRSSNSLYLEGTGFIAAYQLIKDGMLHALVNSAYNKKVKKEDILIFRPKHMFLVLKRFAENYLSLVTILFADTV